MQIILNLTHRLTIIIDSGMESICKIVLIKVIHIHAMERKPLIAQFQTNTDSYQLYINIFHNFIRQWTLRSGFAWLFIIFYSLTMLSDTCTHIFKRIIFTKVDNLQNTPTGRPFCKQIAMIWNYIVDITIWSLWYLCIPRYCAINCGNDN